MEGGELNGLYFIVILLFFAVVTAIIGKAKGGSLFVWFLVGFCLPMIGVIAALLHRWERDEPRMRCPRCGAVLPITDQVCTRCGEDIAWS
jgi:hypothetical protein